MVDKNNKLTISDEIGIVEYQQKQLLANIPSIYSQTDAGILGDSQSRSPQIGVVALSESLDDLLARDKQREDDGYPRKIKVGKVGKPSSSGSNKVRVVPTTSEDKLLHGDEVKEDSDDTKTGEGEAGGVGDEAEGEVVGEEDLSPEEGGGSPGSGGEGDGDAHGVEENLYDLGRILTEEFHLPNLKDTDKKSTVYRIKYDLTDRNRGSGQRLNKKATLKQIFKTNIALGRVDPNNIDPTKFLIAPGDRIFDLMSEEKIYEPQATVFFCRDYSGSMGGAPAEVVSNIHLLLYSWLLYQYEGQVDVRFILHDTRAKEVFDFNTYYNSRVNGGTEVYTAFQKINEIVERETTILDTNVYIFYGSDGDDWGKGRKAIKELRTIMSYAARIGICIAENGYGYAGIATTVERYIKESDLFVKNDLLRLESFQAKTVKDEDLIEIIRNMIS